MISPELWSAYRRTRYCVDATPEGDFCLRVDQLCPPADRLCTYHGARDWAFISACNPRSRALDEAHNAARMQALQRLLEELALPSYPARGIADDGAWPAEPGLLVVGAGRRQALALGARFEQYAIVHAAVGAPAELLACPLDAPASPRTS